ncbi:MAG TPA: ComEC/Rec2 family competence protein, partial [Vicinamibacteria bacterium]|nr:ComEC/Rec2 family competence protein [Vicinamibacteria bacterium]
MSRPLLLMAAALAAGCLVGAACPPAAVAALLALSAALLGLGLAASARSAPCAVAAAAFAAGAAAGGVERLQYEQAPLRRWAAAEETADTAVELDGVAARDARILDQRTQLVLDVRRVRIGGRWRPLRGRVRVDVAGAQAATLQVLQGERVRAWAQVTLPRGALTPGAFDPVAYAYREGVHAQGFCKSAALVSREHRLE